MKLSRYLPVLLTLLVPAPFTARAQEADEVLVRGNLIDVRFAFSKQDFFPQYNWKCSRELMDVLGPGCAFALSLYENRGPEWMCCGKDARARIALDTDAGVPLPWKATGEIFEADDVAYYIYENPKARTGKWIPVPYPEGCSHTAVVLGRRISVDGVKEFGTVIAKVPVIRKYSCYNQTITMLPDGSYLAACGGIREDRTPAMFISRDKGKTWSRYGNYDAAKNGVYNYHNLFVHNGALYFMGVGRDRVGLRICRSDDGGLNWTEAIDSHSGIILCRCW